MKKSILLSTLTLGVLSTTLYSFTLFNVDINQKIADNEKAIAEYKEVILKLEEENNYLKEKKRKNPQLYIKKPLFENLNKKYIQRIKLNGATADKLNFTIKDNSISVMMQMRSEEKSANGYFYNSRYFSTTFSIPSDVAQDKISHSVVGDYFEIVMPKK